MFILKKGHQPGVYVPLRALFLVVTCNIPTVFLPGLIPVAVFFVLEVKIHSKPTCSHCISSRDHATYLLRYFLSQDIHVTYVWQIEATNMWRVWFLLHNLTMS